MMEKPRNDRVTNLYNTLCSYENLERAFNKARKRKTRKPYVKKFEENLSQNLIELRNELLFHIYKPLPLKIFILRDPKTRKISKSDFRDRVVHHALHNVIESIFDQGFIYDSYANRKGKGTLKAIARFDTFKQKVSCNNTKTCFVLKADIKHYFETVNHRILLPILKRKISDSRVLWLIRTILVNHNPNEKGKGMPLGNLTSQFFANVYLNELDQYVKHDLKAKYYIRYVDDFIILSRSKKELQVYKEKINKFLLQELDLELHPDKSRILTLSEGISFLGFRIFFHHKLVTKRNLKKFERKFKELQCAYKDGMLSREKALERFQGWLAYASKGNTYKYRKHIIRLFNHHFPLENNVITTVKKHEKNLKNIGRSNLEFSTQKTHQLFKKGMSIEKIAKTRNIKESTIWAHLANLIEYNHLSLWTVLPRNKILQILPKIHFGNDKLSTIKERLSNKKIPFDEINCVLSYVKEKHKKKNIAYHARWYQQNHCKRKCYFNKQQQAICGKKFNYFISNNQLLKMERKMFLELFNNHMNICILPEKEKRRYMTLKEFHEKIK